MNQQENRIPFGCTFTDGETVHVTVQRISQKDTELAVIVFCRHLGKERGLIFK